jgi:signal peptidase I
VIAFRQPGSATRVAVKRVVGLPGESVRIYQGQVVVNGRLQRKTVPEQRALAVPVHDARYVPNRACFLPRWYDDQNTNRWFESRGQFTHIAGPTNRIAWLTYHHGICITEGETHECPVTTDGAYNQLQNRHPHRVHPVADLWISFRVVRAAGDGELRFCGRDGREEFVLAVDFGAGLCQVRRNGKPVGDAKEIPARLENTRTIVSLVDCQFLVAMDDRVVVALPYDWKGGGRSGTSRPFSIGARSLSVQIEDLQVFRDVYYDHPVGVEARWGLDSPVLLSDNEYFVLGDNSTVSQDSRTWSRGPGVSTELFVGKPFLVHWPGRRLNLFGTGFQVPHPAHIRYIR